MKVKTINQILKLKFELPEYHVQDWFEVHLFDNGILIKSGLRHADGETKSPYYYEESTWGRSHKKEALRKFNEFLSKFDVKTKQIKKIKFLKNEGYGKHYLVTIDDDTEELRHIADGWYKVSKLHNYFRVDPNLENALNISMKILGL